MIDNGRSVYTTSKGIVPEKKHIFFSVPEWELMQNLAQDINVPLGNLIIHLAHEELQRRNIKKATNAI